MGSLLLWEVCFCGMGVVVGKIAFAGWETVVWGGGADLRDNLGDLLERLPLLLVEFILHCRDVLEVLLCLGIPIPDNI